MGKQKLEINQAGSGSSSEKREEEPGLVGRIREPVMKHKV